MTGTLIIILACFAGGTVGGLVGVGGGILFVPAMVIILDYSQIDAESTSLLVIVLVAIIGTMRQRSYGNVEMRDAIMIGVLSPIGVVIGVVVSNSVPERALELGFAALALFMAWQLTRKALKTTEPSSAPAGTEPEA